jgi:hypothetical protein
MVAATMAAPRTQIMACARVPDRARRSRGSHNGTPPGRDFDRQRALAAVHAALRPSQRGRWCSFAARAPDCLSIPRELGVQLPVARSSGMQLPEQLPVARPARRVADATRHRIMLSSLTRNPVPSDSSHSFNCLLCG